MGDVDHDGFADFAVIQPYYSGRGVSEGRIWLYLGGPRGPGLEPVWTGQGFSSNTVLSSKAPGIGDVNGDGVPDLMVGSADYSAAADRRQLGVVAVYLSPRDPRKPHPAWYRPGGDPGTPISHWEAPAGDFNGDGLADLVVAQSGWASGDSRGRALLFLGRRVKLKP